MQQYFSNKKENNKLYISDNDWHHIKNVMRMKTEDNIVVVYEKVKYLCKIDIDEKIVNIVKQLDSNSENSIKVSIAHGLIREQKLDTMLKMCTELGMYEYYPVIMERSIVKLSKDVYTKKVNRWQMICKEAAEQSHRDFVPIINDIIDFSQLLKLNYDVKIVCSTQENLINIKKILQNIKNCDKMLMVIGPEGGLSSNEEKLLVENGFIPVSLGKRILRTETAPVYINSVVNYDLME